MTINATTGLVIWSPTTASPAQAHRGRCRPTTSAAASHPAVHHRRQRRQLAAGLRRAGRPVPGPGRPDAPNPGPRHRSARATRSSTGPTICRRRTVRPHHANPDVAARRRAGRNVHQRQFLRQRRTPPGQPNRPRSSSPRLLCRPTLLRPPDRTILEGESVHFSLLASDPNGLPLTYSSNMLPGGAGLDPNTGVFDWTPGFYQHGVYQIPFTVSDGDLSTTQIVTITVLNVNAPPGVRQSRRRRAFTRGRTSVPRLRARSQQSRLHSGQTPANGSLTRSKAHAPTITYTASGLPTGATFDPDT